MSATHVTVLEFMTACRQTIGDDDLLAEASIRMSAHRLRYMPVVHDDQLVGLLSDRDVASASSSSCAGPQTNRLRVRDVMTEIVLSCGPDANLHAVANEMVDGRVSSVVIVEGEHPLRVVGVLTAGDALRGLTHRMPPH